MESRLGIELAESVDRFLGEVRDASRTVALRLEKKERG
jgi:hypothetical protein